MSKRINVNPDHYKVAGRERPGSPVVKTPKPSGDMAKASERWHRSHDRAADARPKRGGKS
jgi:hypothetical protein